MNFNMESDFCFMPALFVIATIANIQNFYDMEKSRR